jgi:HlyD family secretion protein
MTLPSLLRSALHIARRGLWVVLPLGVALLVLWLRVWSPVRVEAVRVDRATVIQEAFGRGHHREPARGRGGLRPRGSAERGARRGGRARHPRPGARAPRDRPGPGRPALGAAGRLAARTRCSDSRPRTNSARAPCSLTAERETLARRRSSTAGAIASLQRDEANDRLRLARADLDRVLAQRSEATRGIDVAAGGAEQRRVAMVRATLLAPFDGLVTRRLREPGDTVTVGSTVLRIVDTSAGVS